MFALIGQCERRQHFKQYFPHHIESEKEKDLGQVTAVLRKDNPIAGDIKVSLSELAAFLMSEVEAKEARASVNLFSQTERCFLGRGG